MARVMEGKEEARFSPYGPPWTQIWLGEFLLEWVVDFSW